MKSRVFLIAALSVCAALVFAQGGGAAGGGQGRRAGGFGQGMGRGGVFGQSELQLAMRADVQRDLNVSAEQKTKLEALRPQRGAGGAGAGGAGGGQGRRGAGGGAGGAGGGAGAGGGNFDPAAMQARMEEQRAAQHKALAEILTPDQMKRLAEISVQIRGNRSIMDPAVQKSLNFSDDQKKKVTDLATKQQEANRSIMEKVRNQEISREEMQSSMEKNNKVLDEELGKILTSDQAAKLKEMQGKPFKADPPPAGRGGG